MVVLKRFFERRFSEKNSSFTLRLLPTFRSDTTSARGTSITSPSRKKKGLGRALRYTNLKNKVQKMLESRSLVGFSGESPSRSNSLLHAFSMNP
jgi:hypothetical protein